jgi:transcriptional regulator with XRE-family HTH domain
MDKTLSRRSGVLLDVARLDYELARRGATQRDLAKVAGVPEVTISRGRHGRHLRESTLRRLTTALLEMPVLAGAELLIRTEPVVVTGSADDASQKKTAGRARHRQAAKRMEGRTSATSAE